MFSLQLRFINKIIQFYSKQLQSLRILVVVFCCFMMFKEQSLTLCLDSPVSKTTYNVYSAEIRCACLRGLVQITLLSRFSDFQLLSVELSWLSVCNFFKIPSKVAEHILFIYLSIFFSSEIEKFSINLIEYMYFNWEYALMHNKFCSQSISKLALSKRNIVQSYYLFTYYF